MLSPAAQQVLIDRLTPKEAYSVDEAALRLSVSPNTIRNLIDPDSLLGFRVSTVC